MTVPAANSPLSSTVPSSSGIFGAAMVPTYVTRTPNAMVVTEDEIELLENNNPASFAATATFFLGIASGILTNWIFTDKLTPEATVAVKIGVPAMFVICLVFFVLVLFEKKRKKGLITRLKNANPKVN